MKGKARVITAVGAVAGGLAFAASGTAATQPVDHFHNVFADTGDVCGIDVAETESISGVFTVVGNGVEVNAYTVQNTWANPANGKSVEFHAAVLNKDTLASPTDNGDGTISIFFNAAGTEQVKAAGALIFRASGEIASVLTLDATTFEFVSFRVLSSGGGSPDVDFCPAVVSALT
jgi:hypothetical protein